MPCSGALVECVFHSPGMFVFFIFLPVTHHHRVRVACAIGVYICLLREKAQCATSKRIEIWAIKYFTGLGSVLSFPSHGTKSKWLYK